MTSIMTPRFSAWSNASEVARALGGRRVGEGWLCHCPVPRHGRGRGDINPSLKIGDGDAGLLVFCHAGCDSLDVLAALRRRGISDMDEDRFTGADDRPPWIASDIASTPNASAIWQAGQPTLGSPVERYLRRRGITIPIPPTIRCAAPLDDGPQRTMMMVAVETAPGEVRAVQVTYLTDEGHKADLPRPRRTIGTLHNGAARLGEAGRALGLAEGTEDALAATQLTGVPCWASLGAGRMHKVFVPDCVVDLHLFSDNDKAGVVAADRTAHIHTNRGRTVVVRRPPPEYKDWGSITEIQMRRAA